MTVIEVICFIAPDGKVFYGKMPLPKGWAVDKMSEWGASLPEGRAELHTEHSTKAGIVNLEMFEEDYDALPKEAANDP